MNSFRLRDLFGFVALFAGTLVFSEYSILGGYVILCLVTSVAAVLLTRKAWWQIVVAACVGGVLCSICLNVLIWFLFASSRTPNASRYGPIPSANEIEFTDQFQKHAFPIGFIVAGGIATLVVGERKHPDRIKGKGATNSIR